MRLVLCLAIAVLAACSSDPGPGPELACTPGESRPCSCSSGAPGAQLCDEDGARLGPCECAGLDGGALDAGELVDAGALDASTAPDASSDAGVDASSAPRDAALDARTDAGWGECSIVPQGGCASGEACRRGPSSPSTFPRSGPPVCEPAGPLHEGQGFPTRDCFEEGVDICGAGLFCQSWGTCVRYCDPAGAPCPPDRDGVAQRCRTDGPAGVPFCTAF